MGTIVPVIVRLVNETKNGQKEISDGFDNVEKGAVANFKVINSHIDYLNTRTISIPIGFDIRSYQAQVAQFQNISANQFTSITSAAETAFNKIQQAEQVSAAARAEVQKNYANLSVREQEQLSTATMREINRRTKEELAALARIAKEQAAAPVKSKPAVDTAMQKAEADIARFQQLRARMEQDYTNLVSRQSEAQFQARTKQWQRGLGEFEKVLNQAKKDEEKSNAGGGGGDQFFKADLAVRGAMAIKDAIGQSIDEYRNFGKEIANLDTLLDKGDGVDKFRKGLLELNPNLGQTSELARGMYQAISSGVESKDALDFIATSAKAARAGLASTFETVDAGTSVMASFGLQGKDIGEIYDKMFETVKRGKVEMPQLAQSIGLVTNISAQAGVSLNEMFAAIATGSRTNRPAQTIEGLRQTLVNIIKPSKEASDLAQQLGVDFSATALKSKGFAEFLNEVTAATKGNQQQMATLFGDVQALSFVMSVTGNQAKQFADDLRGVSGALGTVEEAFAKQQQSFDAQWTTFKNTLLQEFTQILSFGDSAFTGVLKFVNDYPRVFAAAAIAVTGLATAHAFLNFQFAASAASYIPQLIKQIPTLITLMTSLGKATLTTGEIAAAVTGWVGIVAILGVAAYSLYTYSESQKLTNQQILDGMTKTKDQIAVLNEQKTTLNSLQGNVSGLSLEQGKLADIYNTLDTASKDRVDNAFKEKGAVGSLADEVERLNKAKGLELDTKLTDLAARTAEAYRVMQIAAENATKAEQAHQAAQAGGLKDSVYPETGEVITATKQFQDLRTSETQARDASTATTQEFEKLKSSLAVGAGLIGTTADKFVLAKEAQGQLENGTKSYHDTLSAGTGAQNNFTNGLKNAADATEGLTNKVFDLRAEIGRLTAVNDAGIEAATYSLVKAVADKQITATQAREAAKMTLQGDSQLKQLVENNKAIREAQKGVEEVYNPSAAKARTASAAKTELETGIPRGVSKATWDLLTRNSQTQYGTVDPLLGLAVMGKESSGNPLAKSWRGANGLMQLMPATAARFGVNNTFNPAQNVRGGMSYLGWLQQHYTQQGLSGDALTATVLAGYNAGEGAVDKNGLAKVFGFSNSPDGKGNTTGQYVAHILGRYKELRGKFGTNPEDLSKTLQEEMIKANSQASDKATDQATYDRASKALAMFNQGGGISDDQTISDVVKLIQDKARAAGEARPLDSDIRAQLGAGRTMGGGIPTPEAQQTYLDKLREGLNLDDRQAALNMRQLHMADELTAKQEDYNMGLQEALQDIQIQYRLLSQRNLLEEANVKFGEAQNQQYADLMDIQVQMDVLRKQNADDQFTEQRRLLASKREEFSLQQSITDLTDQIANNGINDNLIIYEAHLKDVLDLRNRERDAVIATNRAQLEIANSMTISNNQIRAGIYEHIAGANNLNDAYISGINKTFDALNTKMNSALDALDKKTKGYLSFLIEPAKAYQTSALSGITSKIVDAVFPADVAAKFKSTGNPLLDESKIQTGYLKTIAGAFSGTPTLNSIAGGKSGGIGGLAHEILSGGFGGGTISGNSSYGHIADPYKMSSAGGGIVGLEDAQIAAILNQQNSSSGGIWDNVKNIFSTKDGGIFASRKNILTGQQSKWGGILGGAGDIASMIAPFLGGGKLSNVVGMAGQGASIGSMLGPWGAVAGAAIGGLVGLFTGGTRKQDEQARTAAINQAMSQLQAMKAALDARPPTADPASSTASANQISADYYNAMNQLKDSKTRNIAIQDGHLRVDPLVSQVATAAAAAQAYSYNKNLLASNLVGEFANGVYMDSGFKAQYEDFKRYNGMMPGAYTGKDYIRALIGNGEIVANPLQLERMRRAAGFDVIAHAGLPNYTPQSSSVPRFADGVSFAAPSNYSAPKVSSGNITVNFEAINITGSDITAEEIKDAVMGALKSPQGQGLLESTANRAIANYPSGRRSPKSY